MDVPNNIDGTNSNAGFTPGPYTNTGSGNVSEFGIFNQTIEGFDGYTHSADLITFDLTNTSGTWASAADVLDENANDYYVASHIFVTDDPALTTNSALATGFAAGQLELEINPLTPPCRCRNRPLCSCSGLWVSLAGA